MHQPLLRGQREPPGGHVKEEEEEGTAQPKPRWMPSSELPSRALQPAGATISETEENVPRTPKPLANATEIA